MSIRTSCSHCGARYNVPASLARKTAKCNKCGKRFRIEEERFDVQAQQTVTYEADVSVEWKPGDIILDLYEVTSLLGEGGMGKVFKVHHREWNVDLAVKCPKPEELARAGGAENFEREAETWVNLGLHPHIVSCYYVRELGRIPRLFAEYVDGGSLNDWIHEGKLLAVDKIIDIAIQFAWGLQYAHSRGLVHQDVKPANVMMTREGIAKVTDFGLAKAMETGGLDTILSGSVTGAMVTPSGMTPAYCSPEQANRMRLSPKTDLWSWAVSIFVMFTGEVTWPSGTVAGESLKWYLQEGPQDRRFPKMPREVASLLLECFHESPDERPADMNTVAQRLKQIYQKLTGKIYERQSPEMSRATADSLNNRAVSLVDLGRSEEAEKLWDEALKIQPHHPESVYNRGIILWRNAKINDDVLVRDMEEMRKSHGNNWLSSFLLGLVHLERADCENALLAFDRITDAYAKSEEVRHAKKLARDTLKDSGRLLLTLMDQNSAVNAVSLNSKSRVAISANAEGVVKFWDLSSGECVKSLTGHTASVTSLSLSKSGKFLLTGSLDKTVKLWEITSGYCLHTFKGHADSVMCVHLGKDGQTPLSGSMDGTIKLWDMDSGQYRRSFDGHKSGVKAVCLSPDEKQVFSAGVDGTLRQWDIDTLRCLHTLRGHEGPVNALSMSSNGMYVLTAGADKTVRLWDMANRRCLRIFTGHIDAVPAVAMTPDGQYAVSASLDNSVKLWEVATRRCLHTFEGHTGGVFGVDIATDGGIAFSAGGDSTVRIWRTAAGMTVHRAPAKLSRVLRSEAAFDAMVAYGNDVDGAVKALEERDYLRAARTVRSARSQEGYSRSSEAMDIWIQLYKYFPRIKFNGGWELTAFNGHEEVVTSVHIGNSCKFVVSGSQDKTLKIWDRETGECLRTMRGHGGEINSVTMSRDEKLILSTSSDGTIKLWDVEKGRSTRSFRGHEGNVRSAAITGDCHFVVSGSDDQTLKVWEVAANRCLRTFEGHKGGVNAVDIAPDGRYAISGSADGTVKIWEMTTAGFLGVLADFRGHEGPVNVVAMTADGRYVLSGSADRTVKLWDVSTARLVRTFEGHDGPVTSLCLSGDGRYTLSGSLDTTFRLWNNGDGKCLRVFKGHMLGVCAVFMTPDGRYALSAGEDNVIKMWVFDWELDERNPTAWDEGARVYLDIFLNAHIPYIAGNMARRGDPKWTQDDFKELLEILGYAGYGMLDPQRVHAELDRMAKARSVKTRK